MMVLVDFLCGLGEGVVDGVVLFGSSSEVVFGIVFVGKVVFVLVCSDEVLFGSVCSGVVSVVFGILDVEGVGVLEGDGVVVRIGEDLLGVCWNGNKDSLKLTCLLTKANDFEVAARIQYPQKCIRKLALNLIALAISNRCLCFLSTLVFAVVKKSTLFVAGCCKHDVQALHARGDDCDC
ncbi:hypothetical protein Tco_1554786 [Tanacetum coccineum]